VVVAAKLLGLWLAGAYSGVWRFLSIPDLLVYVRATLFGSVLAVLAVTWAFRFESFSRGVFVIDALVLFLLVVGSRLSFRLLRESLGTNNASSTPVLIYGAGKAGVLLLREVSSNDSLGLRAVGLLDDDPNKRGQRVLGCPVLGAVDQAGEILMSTRAEQVIVSTHAISPDRLAQLDAVCQARQVRVRRMSFVIE
jgi:UDP-GlcNAc:undecaprenyl-phosphate GlcNAc-1-phosphate transferase